MLYTSRCAIDGGRYDFGGGFVADVLPQSAVVSGGDGGGETHTQIVSLANRLCRGWLTRQSSE